MNNVNALKEIWIYAECSCTMNNVMLPLRFVWWIRQKRYAVDHGLANIHKRQKEFMVFLMIARFIIIFWPAIHIIIYVYIFVLARVGLRTKLLFYLVLPNVSCLYLQYITNPINPSTIYIPNFFMAFNIHVISDGLG